MTSALLRWVWLAAYTAGCLYFVTSVERSSFVSLSLIFGFLFLLYGWALYHSERIGIRQMIFAAVFFRLLFFFGMPQLSDDYHRFLWDGQLVQEGSNPYFHLPADYAATKDEHWEGATYLAEMNSQEYYSVYPPLKQAVFAISAWIAQGDPVRGVFALRFILWLAEVLLLLTLVRLLNLFDLAPHRVAVYAFHPLVIVEVIGNVHFEGMVLLFMALSLLAAKYAAEKVPDDRRKALLWLAAGFFFGCAVLVKLTPLLLVPLVLVFLRRFSRMMQFGLGALGVGVLAVSPFTEWRALVHFWSSIDLYFRTFEFNASVYYLVREVGYAVSGYNTIALLGPALSVLSVLLIIAVALGYLKRDRFNMSKAAGAVLLSWLLYLLLSTTVHPWYLVVVVGLLVFYRSWGVWLWTLTVVLSYAHYHQGRFAENYILIAVSYLLPLFVVVLLIKAQHFRR